MRWKSSIAALVFAVSNLGAQSTLAQSVPAEKTQVAIKRDANSQLTLHEKLSKNIFRTDTVQVPYTERVPYQDTESYEVQVPYEVTESYQEQVPYTERVPYTDTETYYEREHRCENYTDHDRQCHNEPVCHTEPGGSDRQCRMEQICRTGRDGRQVCVDKEVCRDVPRAGRRVCRDNQVCRNVPVTRQRCDYVNVPRTRTVTRYRDETRYRNETRTRTVTRYRTETRQRTVTRYREEQRCCRPEQRQVFDRQMIVDVELNFPQESLLQGQETEQFLVQLSGTDSQPQVQVEAKSSIFKYQVMNKSLVDGRFSADMKLIPAWTPADLGRETVSQLRLNVAADGSATLSFNDAGTRPRVETVYQVSILDVETRQPLFSETVQGTSASVSVPVNVALDESVDYILHLQVAREGLNLSQPVSFDVEVTQPALNLAEFSDPEMVSEIALNGFKQSAVLGFRDSVRDVAGIDTHYRVKVLRSSTSTASGYKLMGEATVARADLQADADGRMAVRLIDLGFSAQNLGDFVNPNRRMKVEITVVREGEKLPETIQFEKAQEMKLPAR